MGTRRLTAVVQMPGALPEKGRFDNGRLGQRCGNRYPVRSPHWRAGLLVAVALLAACGGDPGNVQPGAGAQLPQVALTSLRAEAPTTTAALRGDALIINFWATWCGPCRREMPSLERLSRRLAPHRVRVIGVTVDQDLNLAREFVRAHGLTFPNYVDGHEKTLQSALRVRALPETLLVNADGAIAARIAGARDWDGAEGIRLLERGFGLRLGSTD